MARLVHARAPASVFDEYRSLSPLFGPACLAPKSPANRGVGSKNSRRPWRSVVDGPEMDVLLVSSEFAPWVQNSGVAEVVASFSKTLKQVGHSVTVVVPYSIAYEAAGLLLARRLTPLRIEGHGSLTVFDTQLTSGVSLTLVSLGLETNGQNSILAAVLFGRAVAALVKERSELGSRADIVHVHDWFGGLAGLALELLGGSRPPVVLTVYDINQPGMFSLPSESRSLLGPFGDMQQLTAGSELNILGAAMRTASRVTTVSDSYAGLLGNIASSGNVAHVAHELKFPVLGIPGGIDYARFNPAIDPLLVARYDAEDFLRKELVRLLYSASSVSSST